MCLPFFRLSSQGKFSLCRHAHCSHIRTASSTPSHRKDAMHVDQEIIRRLRPAIECVRKRVYLITTRGLLLFHSFCLIVFRCSIHLVLHSAQDVCLLHSVLFFINTTTRITFFTECSGTNPLHQTTGSQSG